MPPTVTTTTPNTTSLPAIIAVGYKVNSERAVQFRKWATGIIDFVDTGHPALLRMWDKRQRGYRAMGYRVESGAPSVGRFEG
ncbi:RhuM family protein [Acidithiobacillus sp. IBUN Pt1247-S3]|uniref:RhuM family protein n=1 Tax=Acidithiobacillus sp. IBUN Pt1247-S3 TaxID=3166642 RepID=UPI0034E45319